MNETPSYKEALHRLRNAADVRSHIHDDVLQFELGLAECIAEVTLASGNLSIGFLTLTYTGAGSGWAATYDTDVSGEWWESPELCGIEMTTFGINQDPAIAAAQATAQAMDLMHKSGILTPQGEEAAV